MNNTIHLYVSLWYRVAVLIVVALGSFHTVRAEEFWSVSSCGEDLSLRGLCVVSDEVIWASGGKASVVRSVDGGANWTIMNVPGFEASEFRSIHAWNKDTACIASAGTPAVILRTEDGGSTWRELYRNDSPQAFFDAIAFENDQRGMAVSDPVNGRILIVETDDGGKTWNETPELMRPMADSGEAAFAASSGCLAMRPGNRAWIATGGKNAGTDKSRAFRLEPQLKEWSFSWTNIPRNESSGIFAIYFPSDTFGVIVGGDYKNESNAEQTAGWSDDGGVTWHSAHSMPSGFRSSVAHRVVEGMFRFVAVGPNGTDISKDGKNWSRRSDTGFHVVRVSPSGTFWAAGSQGRIATSKTPF
jgi:photosystem II stability/assembly factor-like uncharacterized protein